VDTSTILESNLDSSLLLFIGVLAPINLCMTTRDSDLWIYL
jgi:hypothetical protein